MACTYNRRLYKGTPYPYEIELPFSGTNITDLTVTFYTDGELTVTKDLTDITLSGDTMVITLEPEDLEYLADGVLYYTVEYDGDEYGEYSTNSPFVVATPGDYSGSTLEVLLEEAFDSGYTSGLYDCSGGTCASAYTAGYEDGYDSGYTKGTEDCETSAATAYTAGYRSGFTDGWETGYTSGYTDGLRECSGYTQEDLDNAFNSGWTAGYTSGYTDGQSGHTPTPPTPTPDYYTSIPMGFDIISGGTIGWDNSETNVNIEYSIDSGATWHNFTSLNVNAGDQVMFRGSGETGQMPVATPKGSRFTASTGTYFNAYGNLYSLLGSTGVTSLTGYSNATFFGLFSGNTGLISAGNLRMPATELKASCYRDMFTLCDNMTTAPELPAETLLTTTCYMNMFYGSSKLNYVKCLAVNKQPTDTSVWLWGVSETGTFVKHPDAVWDSGASYIPNGWTVIDAS